MDRSSHRGRCLAGHALGRSRDIRPLAAAHGEPSCVCPFTV